MEGFWASLLILCLLLFAGFVLFRALLSVPPAAKISIIISGAKKADLEKAALAFRAQFPGARVYIAPAALGERALSEILRDLAAASRRGEEKINE